MKRTILLVALATATAVWAQASAPSQQPAKPAAPAKEPAKAEAQKRTTVAKKTSRRHMDARHCLDRGNNIEIIKCAEEYL